MVDMQGAFVNGSHHMQVFNSIHKAELISIVEEASAKAAKNAKNSKVCAVAPRGTLCQVAISKLPPDWL